MNRIDIEESLVSRFPNGPDSKSFKRILDFFLYESFTAWEELCADLNLLEKEHD